MKSTVFSQYIGNIDDRLIQEADEFANKKQQKHFSKRFVTILVAAIVVLSLTTAALAATGVLSGIFSAITGGRDIEGEFGSDTRKSIIEHDHVVDVAPNTSVADDGSKLELNAYFADAREIWFEFTLSDAEIPADWSPEHQVLPGLFSLEMIQSNGTVNKWEFNIDEDLSERKIFPGGHSFIDRTNDTHVNEANDDSHRFVINNTALLNDDGSLKITIIVNFSDPYPTIGEKIHLQIGRFLFSTTEIPNDIVMGSDETPEDYYDSWIINRTWLEGVWEFDIDVDSRFTDVSELTYSVVNTAEAEQHGITIHSITVTPTAARIEVTIDTSKSSIINPNYMKNPTQEQLLDYRYMHLSVYAEADGKQYKANGSTIDISGDILEGWFEFGSMYFDAPENLTLVFETELLDGEYTADPVRIPLKLAR